jgi:hypothetical protein
MKRSLGLLIAAFILVTAAFWARMLIDPPKTEAKAMIPFDVNEVLKTAPQQASIQDGGVIACTYVLTDGHRCD